MTAFVSILLCTFQGEKFLSEQLDSLLSQSYSHFEIMVFDDASTDNTVQIIKKYALRYSNIFLYTNPQQLGFVANFEQALRVCLHQNKARYLSLCDQDDYWHKDKLASSVYALQDIEQQKPNTAALVHCDLRLINSKNIEISPSFFKQKTLDFPQKKSLNKLLGYNGVMGNTLLINRHLAKLCLPFPASLLYHDYWISIVNELFGRRKTLHQPLIDYRIHIKNTSNNRQQRRQGGFTFFDTLFKKNYSIPFFGDNRQAVVSHLLACFPNLESHDRALLQQYDRYLSSDMSRTEALSFLFREEFLKNSWKNKVSVFFRILISYKITRKS